MKKILVGILLVLTFSLASCSGNESTPFDKMNDVSSYRMDMVMKDVPIFGNLTITMKVDDDMLYTSDPFGEADSYVKSVDGKEYEYILQTDGSYVLSDEPIESEELENDFLGDFNIGDFEELDNGSWQLKENRLYLDAEETEYMEDVLITINDEGYFDELTFTMTAEGISLDVEVTFSGYNETSVTLPQ